MDCLRTPNERFESLADWPYAPNYIDDLRGYEGMRMHYVDEGPKDADHTFLCVHGEPSWAYLYRHMMPEFLQSGARVVAPDWFGFGRSDKPISDSVYTFNFHRNSMLRLLERLDLQNITLVCQDWGGILGLTLPLDFDHRFKRLIVMNTTIATGQSLGPGFEAWRTYAAKNPDLDVGALMARSIPHLSPSEIAAYDAPFPNINYKAGVRRFPELVMTSPDMEGVSVSKRALKFWKNFNGQSFMAIGKQDPVLGVGAMEWLRANIKGCPIAMIVDEGGHFLQEWGQPIARSALDHFSQS